MSGDKKLREIVRRLLPDRLFELFFGKIELLNE